MNLYINNIRINVISSAGSLNVGTTLNMVKSEAVGNEKGDEQIHVPQAHSCDMTQAIV